MIYCTQVSASQWPELQGYTHLLNRRDQVRLGEYRFTIDRCRLVLGRLLLLHALGQHEAQPPDLAQLRYGGHNKPYLSGLKGHFNLSHAGDWVVCAYSLGGEVGVDIEQTLAIDLDDYQSVLTLAERQRLRPDQPLAFYTVWTLKEAVMKADGRGFYLNPRGFELPHPFVNQASVIVGRNTWFLFSQAMAPDYVLSVAAAAQIDGLRIVTLPLAQLTRPCT